MVAKLSKVFLYTLFFFLMLLYFLPKVNLYYLLEEKLQTQGIVLNNETPKDKGFSLSIEGISLNLKSIESAKVAKVDVNFFLLYNSIEAKEITLASVAATMLPTDIEYLGVKYTIFDPLHIRAQAHGGFGDADIEFSIIDTKLHLELHPSKKMLQSYRQTLRSLKKSKEGVYSYDKTFKF